MLSLLALILAIGLTAATGVEPAAEAEEQVEEPAAPPAELGLDELDELGLGFDLDQLDIFDDLALLAAEDVVVSASRRRQRIEESPSSITVITREQIQASGYDTIVDILRLVPGADVYQPRPVQGAVGLRSFSGWGGEMVLVLVDGRDMALHLFGLPVLMGVPFDIDSIERVEVIRGPGSTLYGANALQGVVNIVTRKPGDAPLTTEIVGTVTSRLTSSAEVKAHGRTGSWGYWASAGWDRRASFDLPDEVGAESFRGRLFVDWHGRDDLTATVEAGVTHLTGELVSFIGDGPIRIFWPYLRGRLSMPRTEVVAVLDMNDFGGELDLALVFPGEPDRVLARAGDLAFPNRSAELTAHHTFDLFPGNSLMVGASARAIHHMKGVLVTCPPSNLAFFDPEDCVLTDVVETRLGLFLQNEWYLRRDLLLNLGGRLDHNSLNAEKGLSPRASLVYVHPSGQSGRISYGRAYRKPTFADTNASVLLDPDPATPDDFARRLQHLFAHLGDDSLLNEYIDSVEFGFRGRFLDERLNVTLEVFASSLKHEIYSIAHNLEPVPGLAGIPTIPEDADIGFGNRKFDQRAFGGELTVIGRPLPWLTLSGSYALDRIYASELDSETGRLVWDLYRWWEPQHRLIGSIRFASGPVRAGLDGFWFSRYFTDTRDPISALAPPIISKIGGVPLINGQVSYRLALSSDRAVEVGLAGVNVFDLDYREVGSAPEGRPVGGGEFLRRRGRLFVRGSF